MSAVEFRDDRTRAVVATAQRAAESGNLGRSLALLAEADGLEAWAGVGAGQGSRQAIVATITYIGGRRRAAEARERAAAALAAEFGDDVSAWTV